MSKYQLYRDNDAVSIKVEDRPIGNIIEEMVGGGLPTGPSKTITIENDGNMTQQELMAKIIDGLKTEPQSASVHSDGSAERGRIVRDPYLILDFTKKVDAYRDEVLGICWDMREHLEGARPYMNGSQTYLTLIEQVIGMTSEIQKLLDTLGDCSYNEARKAKALIEAFESMQKT